MPQGATVYIVRCAGGSYYTGITRRCVEERVSEHTQGLIKGCYTESRLPVELVFSEYYERIDEAVAAERRIKGWSRVKKEAMMRGDFAALSALAQRKKKTCDGGSDSSSFEAQASLAPHPSRRRCEDGP